MKKVRHFRIAMVAPCPFPYPRGTPLRIFRIAEELSRRGHEVHVLTYSLGDEVDDISFRIHRIRDIKSYRKYSPGPTYQKLLILDSLLTIKLLNFLKKYKIDIIHAHNYEGLIISSLIKKFKEHPVIYDAHTLLESELPYYGLGLPKNFKRRIGKRLDRWLPRHADHIITVTDDIKRSLIHNAKIDPRNISVITNGVETMHFKYEHKLPKSHKRDGKKLIFTGNLAPYQRVDLLLKIFKKILNVKIDVRLLILSNSSFNHYEPLANALDVRDHIDILQSDYKILPKFLATAEVALNTRTDCDGIPQKLINYMAAGKAIVSFKGSAKNIVHRKTGLIVHNNDIHEFAKAVLSLLDNSELSKTLGDNARKYADQEYSWEKIGDKLEDVYTHLTTKANGRRL